LVDPTTPVLLLDVLVKAGTWRDFFAPSVVQDGHCHPTAADTMQSVQIGRLHRAHSTDAAFCGWR
jgi:hypothetical protein